MPGITHQRHQTQPGPEALFSHPMEARRITKKINRSQDRANREFRNITRGFVAAARATEDQEGVERYLKLLANTHRKISKSKSTEISKVKCYIKGKTVKENRRKSTTEMIKTVKQTRMKQEGTSTSSRPS